MNAVPRVRGAALRAAASRERTCCAAMEKIVTKGIVLRATATKEADYILNILTDSLGRIAVVARGARRKGSRIAASCELLAFSELTLYQRGNWYYLDEASTISLFDGVRQDIELLSLASYFAEMTECVTAEDEPAPPPPPSSQVYFHVRSRFRVSPVFRLKRENNSDHPLSGAAIRMSSSIQSPSE